MWPYAIPPRLRSLPSLPPESPAPRTAGRGPRSPTCIDLSVSSKCSFPSLTISGRRTEALGSGKWENLSPTSNSLKRSLAFSFTLSLEANREERRDTPRLHPGTPRATCFSTERNLNGRPAAHTPLTASPSARACCRRTRAGLGGGCPPPAERGPL